MVLEQAVHDYERALIERADGATGPDALTEARGALLAAVGRCIRASEDGGPLLTALESARRALARARGAGLSPADLAFEEGSLDAAAHILQLDPVVTLQPEVRRQVRSVQVLNILRVLREHPELPQGELVRAARARPSELPPSPSEEQVMSRRVKELRELGLVFSARAGRQQMVRLTGAGTRLLEHVDRGHLPDAAVRVESAEIPEHRIRSLIHAFAEHPHVEECAENRLRYYLMTGGLYVVDEMLGEPRWDKRARIVANLLWQHPLTDSPYADDLALFDRLTESWPSGEDWKRDLIRCIYRQQSEGNRGGLASEMLRFADRIGEASPWTLLWAPAAITAATWDQNDMPRVVRPLLEAVSDRLREIPRVPLALHLRAFVASLRLAKGEAVTRFVELQGVRDPDYGRHLTDAIRNASSQFLAAAPLNETIVEIDARTTERLQSHAHDARRALDMPEAGRRDVAWMDGFLDWIDADAPELATTLLGDEALVQLHRRLLERTARARDEVRVARADFDAAVLPYESASRWFLGAKGRPRHDGRAPVASLEREHLRRRYRNNADGPGHLATARLEQLAI